GIKVGVGCSAALAAVIGLGLSAFAAASTPHVFRNFRVAVLQTNLPQDNKLGWPLAERVATHRHWLKLSEEAAAQTRRPQLIVWPETMFPGFALNPEAIEAQRRAGLNYTAEAAGTSGPLPTTWFADTLIDVQTPSKIPFLIGSIAADGLRFTAEGDGVRSTSDARTNSVLLLTDGRVQSERYDKVDLMAFGEYIPVLYRWPGAQTWLTGLGAKGMAFDLAFGTSRTIFNVEGVRIGTPICFEVCHEAACRAFTTTADGHRRADLLVNITNDGWFYGSTFNRQMHLLQARWRCAEIATPMVRAANTGISCVIDAAGKVLTPSLDGGKPLDQTEGVLTADVPLVDPAAPPTFYARIGHHLNTLIAAVGAVLVALALLPRRKATEPASPLAT
ncbi:MAG: apolipoprotein N-acyltransferase, partial [Phycisphaerales bacterium]|nr:apolipoprotein N-acyltransferase [Phycisphaerales bacterium]